MMWIKVLVYLGFLDLAGRAVVWQLRLESVYTFYHRSRVNWSKEWLWIKKFSWSISQVKALCVVLGLSKNFSPCKNFTFLARSKHIDLRYHYRDVLDFMLPGFKRIQTGHNDFDMLAKFEGCCQIVRMEVPST